ncbi:hypothetical protein [Oleiharenicola sp. Vm1]|uniref:hypothetical protein n=1 Tax=Oleiharenicola sp. Vm1 TaxID=3398393 RepID=UPI0039F4A320
MNAHTDPTYYSVGRNGTWTTEPAPASFFTSRGATISPSRIHPEDSGIMTLWIDGTNAGTLFPKQEDQIAHLRAHGLLDAAPLPKPAAPATRGARCR